MTDPLLELVEPVEAEDAFEPFLTAQQIGERLGMSTSWVLDKYEATELPGYKLGTRAGNRVRFLWSEVEATLDHWRTQWEAELEAKRAMKKASCSRPTPVP